MDLILNLLIHLVAENSTLKMLQNDSYSRYHLGSHARCDRFDLQEA